MADEDDFDLAEKVSRESGLPKATVLRLVKEQLPDGVRLGVATRDSLHAAITEFVTLVSAEANEIATKANKNVVTPENIVEALKVLKFADYVADVQAEFESHRDEQSTRVSAKKRFKQATSGMTDEELEAEQAALFAAAAAAAPNQ
jgi:histone H3/H4